MPSKKYQGHKNYNFWNVALWIANDEGIYRFAKDCISETDNRDQAVERFLAGIHNTHTPDGAPYTKSAVRAAMIGL